MKEKLKISFYLRANYFNKLGESPINIRVFLNGEKRYFGSTGFFINKEMWDNDADRVIGRTPTARTINMGLNEIELKILDIARSREGDSGFNVEKLYSIYAGKVKTISNFIEFYEDFISGVEQQIGHGKSAATVQKYKATKKHFLNFLKIKYGWTSVSAFDMTPALISDFDIYLRTTGGMQGNSATKTLKSLKTVTIQAQKVGFLDHDPFINLRFHLKPVDRGFLTEEEIEVLMSKKFGVKRLEHVRDIFVFSCFTGLAYIDVSNLTDENIVTIGGTDWIMTKRQKTSITENVPILDVAREIINKYHSSADRNGRLLPILSNQKMNAYLKEIADLCGIKKRLSYHMARHTYATLLLSKGVPMETVSKLLGHTNIKTTQIYARITNKKIEQDVMRVADQLNAFNSFRKL
ncbi:MAG: site-specific integrase [Bacteroidaceae bacterium]|nr:site-specific integrase [Bacteroidaceae bacterium]